VQVSFAVLALASDRVLAQQWRREAMPLAGIEWMAAVALSPVTGLAVPAVEDDL
jgi:hypothetical protein